MMLCTILSFDRPRQFEIIDAILSPHYVRNAADRQPIEPGSDAFLTVKARAIQQCGSRVFRIMAR